MKKAIVSLVFVIGAVFSANAQDTMTEKSVKTITLEQTPGEFTQKALNVSEGTYVFEIKNNGVDHQVGFVLVKKGEDIKNPENHIQTAYVTAPVEMGEVQKSNPTTLEKGEYVYFCPLNPTATDNVIVVK